jgi:hypothetical protein
MMANRSQKNPIKKATLTRSEAAFFKLLKMTVVPLVIKRRRRIRRQLSMRKTNTCLVLSKLKRPRVKLIHQATTATKSSRLNEWRRKAR